MMVAFLPHMILVAAFILGSLDGIVEGATTATCVQYKGSRCSNYGVAAGVLRPSTTQGKTESLLGSVFDYLDGLGLSQRCVRALKELNCRTHFPPCFGPLPQKVCFETCDSVEHACSEEIIPVENLVDCHRTLTDNATAYPWPTFGPWVNSDTYQFDEFFEFTTSDGNVDVPCWNRENGDFGEDLFWEMNEAECLARGGQWTTNAEISESLPDPMELSCKFTTRRQCIDNHGEWIFDHTGTFFCYFYLDEHSEYETLVGEPLLPPYVEFGEEAIHLDTGTLLPVPLVFSAEPGSEIAVAHMEDPPTACVTCLEDNMPLTDTCNSACLPSLPPPDIEYFDFSDVVKVRPEGFFFEIVTPGLHVFRLKAYATNREESVESLFVVTAIQRTSENADLFRPPEDSGKVYLWSEVNFPVANPRRFDVIDLLSAETVVNLQFNDVFVLEVTQDGVKFEVRVPERHAAEVETKLADPLLLYPFADLLFEYGLLNSTDKCSAYTDVVVKTDVSKFIANAQRNYTTLIAGVAGGLVGAIIVFLLCVQSKVRRLRAQEQALNEKDASVKKQEEDLKKREEEMANKLRELEDEQSQLLAEKQVLAAEENRLQAEAEEAQRKIEELEKEELADLDPSAEVALSAEEATLDADVKAESEEKLDLLRKRFKELMPEKEVDEKFQTLLEGIKNGSVFEGVPQREAGRIAGASNVAVLKNFGKQLSNETQKEQFLAYVDEQVRSGALKEVAQDEQERIRNEYDEAMFALQQEIYQKKKENARRIANKRKQRLNLVIEDADKKEEVEEKTGLELAVESEIEQTFEAEKAELRSSAPSEEDFESALAVLEQKREDRRKVQLEKLQARRQKVKQKLAAEEQEKNAKRQEIEMQQKRIAEKVSSVFKKITSVDSKVNQLKTEHNKAKAKLEKEVHDKREAQRLKLEQRRKQKKRPKKDAKVAPM